MSPLDPLEILQVIGYSIGALLPLWMLFQLITHRSKLSDIERLLALLALKMGGWHTRNLPFAYSFLLHVHLHLWANAHGRSLNRGEYLRVYLSYIPTIFLVIAVPTLWMGDYAPMFTKLSFFVIPFAFWIAYVLGLIALTELLMARKTTNRSERRIMRTLAASFIGIGVVIFAALAAGVGAGTVAGLYLKTIANLGSLLPSVLLAYYIYRYRYLEIIIEESLVVVTFATVVLTVYVFGIRTIGDWMTQRYGTRPGLVEALLILALALLAAPLRGWLAQRFHKLFEREAALYKEILSRIGAYAGQYKDLSDLLHFVEERTTKALNLRKLNIFVPNGNNGAGFAEAWVDEALALSQASGWEPLEDEPLLLHHGFKLAYPMRREEKVEGLLAVDALSATLTTDVRSVMELLAGQAAMATDDYL